MSKYKIEKGLISRSVKWLYKYSEGIRWRMLWSCLLGLARVAFGLVFIYISKQLIDMASGAIPHTQQRLVVFAVSLVVLMLLQIACSITNSYLRNQTEIKMKNSLRQRIFAHLIKAKWNGIEQFHSGDLINRLEEDVRVITDTLCSNFSSIVIAVANLIAAFVFLCTMNAKLAWTLVVIMPFFMIMSKIYIAKVRAITKKVRDQDSTIQSTIQESLQHRMLIQTMEKEEQTEDRLAMGQDTLYEYTMERTRFTLFSRSMVNIGFAMGYLTVFIWSIWQIKAGVITFGVMTAFLQLVNQIQHPTVELTRQIPALVHTTTSIDRLTELEQIPEEPAAGQHLLASTAGVRFNNVTFRYSMAQRYILRNFSQTFAPGSRSAVVGETGAGKSTTIKLILALLEPLEGSVEIYSKDESAVASNATRCNIAYVPQGNSLLSGTIRDNLLLGNPEASDQQMKEALHTAAADFVENLPEGLDTQIGERSAGLSEGQAQRIAIARGLLRKGSILIMDEFSSSLDSSTEELLIQRLMDNYRDKTMLFITHRDRIVSYCDQVIKLKR